MKATKAVNALVDPFPTKKLRLLNFGSADGSRDELVESTFVLTSSVKKFLLNTHSIVIGPIGSGKSALFRLLKENSPMLNVYKDYIISPIEESVSFQSLNEMAEEYFPNQDESVVYKMLWKFQICLKICESLTSLNKFPNNESEKRLMQFLDVVDSGGKYKSVADKLKSLFESLRELILIL